MRWLLAPLFLIASACAVSNEVGPVGMDTDGRQIFLQTLEHRFRDSGVRVTSEWDDSNILQRFAQEPMRTTFRLIGPGEADADASRRAEESLALRFDEITVEITEISMGSDRKMSGRDFEKRLRELGVVTVADMLGAMGFRRYELFAGSKLVFARDLPVIGRGNVKHVGGERRR